MDKNEAVVRVLNNKKGDDDFTGAARIPGKWWLFRRCWFPSIRFPRFLSHATKYRYLHILKTNIAKYRSTSVSECNFDKPAYFLAIGFIRFSKNVWCSWLEAFINSFESDLWKSTFQQRTSFPGMGWRAWSHHHPLVHKAPSSGPWLPPWWASHRGW